jgi:hypothetical protein
MKKLIFFVINKLFSCSHGFVLDGLDVGLEFDVCCNDNLWQTSNAWPIVRTIWIASFYKENFNHKFSTAGQENLY